LHAFNNINSTDIFLYGLNDLGGLVENNDNKKVIKSVAGGAVGGAAAAGGAVSAVSALGTASTGTAIATLSGASSTSATIAWFGGGAVAGGGWRDGRWNDCIDGRSSSRCSDCRCWYI